MLHNSPTHLHLQPPVAEMCTSETFSPQTKRKTFKVNPDVSAVDKVFYFVGFLLLSLVLHHISCRLRIFFQHGANFKEEQHHQGRG